MAPITLQRLCEELVRRSDRYTEEDRQTEDIEPTERAMTDLSLLSGRKNRPIDLAVDTIRSIDVKHLENLNQDRRDAIAAIVKFHATYTAQEIVKLPDHTVKELIQNFSKAFLLGELLPSMITFKFEDIVANRGVRFGQQEHLKNTIEIIIDTRDHHKIKNVKDHKTALISTLFHECLHAYFSVYSCESPHEFNQTCGFGNQGWDTSGHFFPWFYLAAGIDIAMDKFLNFNIDLAAFKSLLVEYGPERQHPRYLAEEWKRFFQDYTWDSIDKLVRKLTDDQFEGFVRYVKLDNKVVYVFQTQHGKACAIPMRS